MAEPVNFLKKCNRLLKPDGRLFLSVPNLDTRQARCLGPRWPLLLAEHLNDFNCKSLSLCGQRGSSVPFRQRPRFFSVTHILQRLSQHSIPGASFAQMLVEDLCGKSQFHSFPVRITL